MKAYRIRSGLLPHSPSRPQFTIVGVTDDPPGDIGLPSLAGAFAGRRQPAM
jgi:hypothetical protein